MLGGWAGRTRAARAVWVGWVRGCRHEHQGPYEGMREEEMLGQAGWVDCHRHGTRGRTGTRGRGGTRRRWVDRRAFMGYKGR